MNPANFQNLVGPQPGNQQQAGQQQNTKVQHHIFRMLQQQQTPPGWQAAVPLQKRTRVVWELVSSLRLIKPDMDVQQSINVAVTFEQKTFYDSPDQASYEQACHQKLKDITDTRTKQARNTQQQFQNPQQAQVNMTPQQMQMQGMVQNQTQGQFPHGFQNPQLQQAVQMQQQLSHQPQLHIVNASSSLQPGQNRYPPQSQIPPQNGPPMFTPEEQQQINRMAQIMAQNTPKEQLDLIQAKLRDIAPEMRQNLAMQNIDPLTFYFRNQATNGYVTQKAHHAAQRNQMAGAPDIGSIPQQSRPTSQNPAGQAAGGPPPQNFDSSQILVQQQKALRSQEAGQVVVPASNSQAMVEPQRGNVRGPSQQPNGQGNGGRPMQNPTQQYYAPQANTQQVHNVPMQPQLGNFGNIPNQAPQHNLQGQPNGLNTPGRTPQQNPNMPNLNRAFGSPNQQAQPAMWRPQANQQKDQSQLNPQPGMHPPGQLERPDAGQQRQRPPMLNMPPELQQRLANMPEEQRNIFITQLHHRQRQQMRVMQEANARAQGPPGPTLMQDPSGKPGPHFMGTQPQPTNVQNGNGLQHPVMVQQPPSGQQSIPPQRQQQQPQPNMDLRNQQRAAQAAGNALTEEQTQQMDNQNFPSAMLNMGGALSTLPKDVKTWGQLKSWVTQNQGTLPHESLTKLKGLQGLHYQNLVGQQRAKLQKARPNATGQVQGQGTTQSRAPPAVMVSPNNPAPLAAPNTPRTSTPTMMHSLPQPTVQAIQASRARLPDHMKGLTDEQIRVQILKQRQLDLLKIAQNHTGMTPQQQAQYNQMQKAQQQSAQQIQFQTSINPKMHPAQPQPTVQRQQPQPSPRPGAPLKTPVLKQPQGARAGPAISKPGQANQKGVKRNSNDDVIEVPNPNVATATTRVQPPNTTQVLQQPRLGVPLNVDAQSQRAQLDVQRQLAAQQTSGPAPGQSQGPKSNGQMNTGPQRTEEQIRKDALIQRFYMELIQSTPRGNPVAMAPQARAKMIQLLRENTKLVVRIPSAIPVFFNFIADEQTFRDVLRTHYLISLQYRDKKCEGPADHFTLAFDELDAALKKLNNYFAWLMTQVNSQRQSNQGVPVLGLSQNQAPAPQPQSQPPKEAMPVLNAANLQQQQLALHNARAANLQKNHNNAGVAMLKNPINNSSRTPAAPTSTQPPFPLGGQPPHGVPRAYGDRPNELTRDKLVIPSAKRRKGNQAQSTASTPVLAQGAPTAKSSPQVSKIETPEVQRPSPASMILKCHDPDCSMSAEEFATQSDLDAHQQRIHPNFNDPLEFCLESIRMGLNLDENGESKPRPAGARSDGGTAVEILQMKNSASTQGQAMIKQETATPMTRVTTQTGPSPTSNLLKTPQPNNVKTPGSDAKSARKDGKVADPKASQAAPKTPTPATEDPWAGSDIPASVITSAFSDLLDLQSLGPWTKIQDRLTPESTLSSGNAEKNSPRPSDISENDVVNISINVDDGSWMPSEWFTDGMTGIEALNMNQELQDLDWSFEHVAVADTGKAKKGKEKRDEFAPSAEWLKIWAPDRL